eukprot:15333442-Ditylum_brightwellii.AAC.1
MTIEVEDGIIMTEVMVIVTVQIDASMITTEVEDGTIMIEMLVVNDIGIITMLIMMNEGIDILIGKETSITGMADEEGGNGKLVVGDLGMVDKETKENQKIMTTI